MLIATWQQRCGIDAYQDPTSIDQKTIMQAMQAEIDELRVANSMLEVIAQLASRVSVMWESEWNGAQKSDFFMHEYLESLDQLSEALQSCKLHKD